MSETASLDALVRASSPDVTIGIGLAEGDEREDELVSRAVFCPTRIYRSPERLLSDVGRGVVQAAVRGSLAASEFLGILRGRHPGVGMRRIALLATPGGKTFLLAPVGIDEGGTLKANRTLARDLADFCRLLGWEPRVAALSAGRPEDVSRGRAIAESIRRGELLEELSHVRHFYINIEDAINWGNCIIAPDGVSGNLVYRTLTHLGGGGSLGALYFPLELHAADTSRSGTVEEYLGAIALANIGHRGQAREFT